MKPSYCKDAAVLRDRFGLSDGQVVTPYTYKNLWWEINGDFFGYGDLGTENIFEIQNKLTAEEIFRGWNEHHGSDWQQTNVPMIRILHNDITMHADLVDEKQLEGLDEYYSQQEDT